MVDIAEAQPASAAFTKPPSPRNRASSVVTESYEEDFEEYDPEQSTRKELPVEASRRRAAGSSPLAVAGLSVALTLRRTGLVRSLPRS